METRRSAEIASHYLRRTTAVALSVLALTSCTSPQEQSEINPGVSVPTVTPKVEETTPSINKPNTAEEWIIGGANFENPAGLDTPEDKLLNEKRSVFVSDMRQLANSAFNMEDVTVTSSDFMKYDDINYYERAFIKDGLLYTIYADAPGEEDDPYMSLADFVQIDVLQFGNTLPKQERDSLRTEDNPDGNKLIAQVGFSIYAEEGRNFMTFYGFADGLDFSSQAQPDNEEAELFLAQHTFGSIQKRLLDIETA